MLHSSPRVIRRAAVAGLVALALVAAACGSDDDASSATDAPAATEAGADVTTAPADTEPASTEPASTDPVVTDAPLATEAPATTEPPPLVVPAGTSLRVGDQQGTLELPLKSSGLIDEVQSSIEYSTFAGGPPLLEAFNAGAIDLGYVGDTPPILAQARDQDIVIVAAWRYDGKLMAVVAPPGKEISSVADLAGKKFAYPTGTALQAFALRALEEVGLTEGDIDHVDVPALETIGVLQSGAVDAAVLIEPLLTPYLTDNPGSTVVRDADGLTTGLQLLITTSKVLADPAKAAAVGDYAANLAESFVWRTENPEAFLQSFADLNQITLEQAQEIADRNGTQLFGLLDDSVVDPLQSLADLFHSSGVIPEEIDVSQIVDDRFNPYVAPYVTQ